MSEGVQGHKDGVGIWNSVFIKIFLINMMSQYCVYSMNTLSSPYAKQLGATATIVGVVSSYFALTALIFKFVSAPAIDAFNRKYVLIGSLTIMLASFVGYAFSMNIPALIASRLLTGVGLAFVPICCIAIASDSLPAERMGSGIGYFSLGTVVCQAFAPAIGLKLADIFGYNLTFGLFGGLIALTMVFALTLNIEYKPKSNFHISFDSIIAPEVFVPTAILFLLNMVFCNVNAFLVLFGREQGVGTTQIGYFFTMQAATLVFSRPLIGRLADRFGSGTISVASILLSAVAFYLISCAHALPMFLLAAFVSAFGYAGCQPALMAVSMKCVPKERRGAAGCTSYIGQDLGNLAGPLIAGAIIERMGYVSMWRLMIIPILMAMLIGIFLRRKMDHAGEQYMPAK